MGYYIHILLLQVIDFRSISHASPIKKWRVLIKSLLFFYPHCILFSVLTIIYGTEGSTQKDRVKSPKTIVLDNLHYEKVEIWEFDKFDVQ